MINKKGKEIGTFDKYTIQCTQHAQSRMGLREIDSGKVVSAVLSIGINHLNLYHNMQLDVMVTDKENGFSVVFEVRDNMIVLITVIDKADCFIKPGTIVEEV